MDSKYEELIVDLVTQIVYTECGFCHAVYTCDKSNRDRCIKTRVDEYKEEYGIDK